MPIPANKLLPGDPLANSLQPTNVALAELIESVRRLEPAIRGLEKTSSDTTKELAKSTFSLGNFSAGLSRSAVLLGLATHQFSTFTSAVESGIASAVAAFDPSAVKRWELTVRDLHAVFGDIFRPVLERATVVVRALADGIESLSPSSKTMVAALAVGAVSMATMTAVTAAFAAAATAATGGLNLAVGAVAGVVAGVGTMALSASEFRDTVREVAAAGSQVADELGRAAADLMKQLQPAIKEWAKSAVELARLVAVMVDVNREIPILTGGLLDLSTAMRLITAGTIPGLLRALRELTGLGLPPKAVGGSTGKAVVDVKFGSAEDAWREAVKNAFSMGTATQKPEEKTANHMQRVRELLERWDGWIQRTLAASPIPVPGTARSNRAISETPFKYLDGNVVIDRLRQKFD